MTTTVDGLRLRRILGPDLWLPPDPFGPDGWRLDHQDTEQGLPVASVIVSTAPFDGVEWTHASMANAARRVPTYEQMCLLHRAVWGDDGESYEVHPPLSDHVNLHPYALHLWGRADGKRVLPNFGIIGSI